jgi:hypothetical protein
MTCVTCGVPVEGCVEECGSCFVKTMEREFHLFANQKFAPFTPTVPAFRAKHMSTAALAEANAALLAAHKERTTFR